MINIAANIANILEVETDSTIVTEILEFIGDAFHSPEAHEILQNICYNNGTDAQDFISAMDSFLVEIGLNGD